MPWAVEVQLHAFLTSVLDGGDRSASNPGCFKCGARGTGFLWMGGWVIPDWLLKTLNKSCIKKRMKRSMSIFNNNFILQHEYMALIWIHIGNSSITVFASLITIAWWWSPKTETCCDKNTIWALIDGITHFILLCWRKLYHNWRVKIRLFI